jgi:hypothetical protein
MEPANSSCAGGRAGLEERFGPDVIVVHRLLEDTADSCDDAQIQHAGPQMTHRAEPDPTAAYGEQLHELLTEALLLAQVQLESMEPDPDSWQQLAQRTYRFRSELPANDAGLDELQAFAMELEHTLLGRSRLEAEPPQRVLFFGQNLLEARRAFDTEMTERLMPLAEALVEAQSTGG